MKKNKKEGFLKYTGKKRTTKANPKFLEIRERVCRKEDSPLVNEGCVRDHLDKLDSHRSKGPNGMHP